MQNHQIPIPLTDIQHSEDPEDFLFALDLLLITFHKIPKWKSIAICAVSGLNIDLP